MLTLASHNICMNQLLDGEVNWSQLVTKKRKRNDDTSHNTSLNSTDSAFGFAVNSIARILLALPDIILLRWLLPTCFSYVKRFRYLIIQYHSERIFIKYCSLVR